MLAAVTAAAVLLAGVPEIRAASAGSRNKDGNRLYEQGKYEEAEKAYFDALANSPGRPEITYNLGNALIRRQKYDQALQALREAESKGEGGLRADSWYNIGNALFEMNRFKDAAGAYIQALRLVPGDREAKHNLELALKRQKEQEQQGSAGGHSQQQEQQQQQQPAGGQQEQQGPRPGDPQSTQGDPRDVQFTREQALQILDALQNQELLEQRKMLERRLKRKAGGRDW